jgi:hypothetical protein
LSDEKVIFCPFCEEAMRYEYEKDFYYCPNGCCEVWPKEKEYDAAKLFWQEIRDKKGVIPKRSGGSRSGKKYKKKKPAYKASDFFYLG